MLHRVRAVWHHGSDVVEVPKAVGAEEGTAAGGCPEPLPESGRRGAPAVQAARTVDGCVCPCTVRA